MFDIIILILILISALFAFFRGFSLELLSISVWIISFFGSYAYGNNLINFFNKIINNILISTAISYVVTFFIIFVIFSFLTRKFSVFIKDSYVGLIDKSLGFIFGILRGYVIVGLCFFLFDYFYNGKRLEFIDNSKIIPVIKITNNEIFRFLKIDNNSREKPLKNANKAEINIKTKIMTSNIFIDSFYKINH